VTKPGAVVNPAPGMSSWYNVKDLCFKVTNLSLNILMLTLEGRW
jgi:hypothetical protein